MPQEEARTEDAIRKPATRHAARAIVRRVLTIWQRRSTPYLLLALVPVLPHLPAAFLGLSANPIWTMSWIVSGQSPGPFPGLPFGDPNVGWTNQALGHLAAHDWLTGRVPWWNPYSGIGLPLAGEMQPSALFLPFILLLILPHGLFWLEYAMQVLAGVATYALLRHLDCSRFAALTGGLLYALSGTFVIVPGESMLNVIPFLPVLLLGIENARFPATARLGVVLVALGIGFSLLGGFPEAAFIDGLLALVWTVCRGIETEGRIGFLLRIGLGGIAGLAIAAPQLVAFFDFVAESDVFANHGMGVVSIPLQGFAPIVFPDVFGPISNPHTTALLSGIFGAEGGFLGLPLLFAGCLGAWIWREHVLKLGLLLWLVLCAGKLFGFPPIMSAMNLIPFMKQTEFIRYAAASWEMPAIIFAAIATDRIRDGGRGVAVPAVVTAFLAALAIAAAWPWAASWHRNGAAVAYMAGWFAGAVGMGVLGVVPILFAALSNLHASAKVWIMGGALIGEAVVLAAVPLLSGMHPGTEDRPAIAFLRRHLGLERFYSVGPIAPNYAAYFDLESINDNYLPVAKKWGNYIDRKLFPQASIFHGNIFWAQFPPFNASQALGDLLAYPGNFETLSVRYVVTGSQAMIAPQRIFPTGTAHGTAVGLDAGQSVVVQGTVPANVAGLAQVTSVGVFQANYGGKANGIMAYRLCSKRVCASGQRNLDAAADDALFYIRLDRPMHLVPGDRFTLYITHVSGNHREGLWLFPDASGEASIRSSSIGLSSHRVVRIGFADTDAAGGIASVYRDRLMTIWRLPHPQPYFSVTGGSCGLADAGRDAVTADCDMPAILSRRELYMPGWTATANGAPVPVMRDGAIFQRVALPKGRTRVVFSFVPPYMRLAELALALGWIGLASLMMAEWFVWRRRPC